MLSEEEHRISDIKKILEISAEKYGGRTAFWVEKEDTASAITYSELYGDVCGLGTSLTARGMKNKRIAIVGERAYEWAVSYLAVICGTGVAVPLDKEFCINELKQFLNATQCSCVIFSEELENAFRQIRDDGVTGIEILINMDRARSEWDIFSLRELIDEGKALVDSGNRNFQDARIIIEELCSIMLTAGTTDVPKGVELSHANISTEITLVSSVITINESDVFFSRHPAHCACECICGTLLPLYKGASISYCKGVQYNFDVSELRGYSLTECSSIAALNPDKGSSGLLIPGMHAKIADPDPETGIGEICLAGENIMMGYCYNPKGNADVLKDGWFYTGDLGRIDEKGYIYISGRKENVIITEDGKKVYPEELESCLSNITCILESMVWSKHSDRGGSPIIVATILVNEEKVNGRLGAGYSETELERLLWIEIDKINDKLPSYKEIKKIILRREPFEKNSSKKNYSMVPCKQRRLLCAAGFSALTYDRRINTETK